MSITIRDVTNRFGEFHALPEASLEVESGELVAVLGLSGAGRPHCRGSSPAWRRPTRGASCPPARMPLGTTCATAGWGNGFLGEANVFPGRAATGRLRLGEVALGAPGPEEACDAAPIEAQLPAERFRLLGVREAETLVLAPRKARVFLPPRAS